MIWAPGFLRRAGLADRLRPVWGQNAVFRSPEDRCRRCAEGAAGMERGMPGSSDMMEMDGCWAQKCKNSLPINIITHEWPFVKGFNYFITDETGLQIYPICIF